MKSNGNKAYADLAPHSIEAEEAVLGSILLNQDVFYELNEYLNADSFFILRNAWVWEAMHELAGQGFVIDILTVKDQLSNMGRLEEIGGGAYLTYLINNTPTSINAGTYAKLVEQDTDRRRLLNAASEIAQYSVSSNHDANAVKDMAVKSIFEAVSSHDENTVMTLGEALANHHEEMSLRRADPAMAGGYNTGITALDMMLDGLKADYLYTLTAATGLGKTSFALHIARKVASAKVHPGIGSNHVVFFSLEMSAERLAARFVTNFMKANSRKVQRGDFDSEDEKIYRSAVNYLSALPITIVDARGYTMERIMTKTEQLRRQIGSIGLIVIDYLGEINTSTSKYSSYTEELARIMQQMKTMSSVAPGLYRFGCPVLLLAQMNRETAKSGKVSLFGFADSSGVEKASDCAIGIYRNEDDPENQARIAVMKHRDGPTGEAPVYYRKEWYFWGNLEL